MKEDLLQFNKSQHGTMSFSPLCEENDVELIEFYVQPTLYCFEHRSAFGRQRYKTKRPLKCFRDMFFENSNRFKEIYLISDAGLGKTAFGKWLITSWCRAHSPQENDEKHFFEDILSVMKNFEFAFLVLLRDSYKLECDVDFMILNEICNQLSRSSVYKIEVLQEILHRENCLVILDGLDEWSHPEPNMKTCPIKHTNIPHRKVRNKCTILTTTRPWKFDRINLKFSQIDQLIELTGLTKQSSKTLVENLISKLNRDCCTNSIRCTEDFNAELQKKNIDELESIPLLLMHLIYLWCDERALGHSRCEIFCNFITLILSQADTRYGNIAEECNINTIDTTEKVKKVFRLKMFSKKYHKLLYELSRLAFETLLEQNKECSLVFDKAIAERYMKEEYITFCLKIGLLKENKMARKLTTSRSTSKISFPHKTFQEYFSALYIETLQDPSDILLKIMTVCKTEKIILELSNVFSFMSGLCPKTLSILSEKLLRIIAEDEITQKYRSSACSVNYWNELNTMKCLQNMFVTCLEEFLNNAEFKDKHISLCMEDFFLDANCRSGNYGTILMYIFKNNKKQIKSIHINDVTSSSDLREIIDVYEVRELRGLEKLDMWIVMEEDQLDEILSSSVDRLKHLLLHTGHWDQNRWIENYIGMSDNSLHSIQKMIHLETVSLWDLVFTHSQLGNLLEDVSQKTRIKQIGLGDIKCLDHGELCNGYELDLSKHDEFSILQINQIPLTKLKTSISSLLECHIGSFSNSDVLLSLLESLKNSPKVQTFGCFSLYTRSEIERLLSTIPSMITLRRLLLNRVDLGEECLSLPLNATSLELIKLKRIKISTEALLKLVGEIENRCRLVTVQLVACEIMPPGDVSKIKEHITSSKSLQLIGDSVDQFKRHIFSFRHVTDQV